MIFPRILKALSLPPLERCDDEYHEAQKESGSQNQKEKIEHLPRRIDVCTGKIAVAGKPSERRAGR